MKKIIISLIMAAIIFCVPVSAVEEPVYLPNYGGFSYRNDGSVISSFKVGTLTYFGQATSNNASPGVYFEAQFELNKTYHIRYWFDVSKITGLTVPNFFKDELLIFTFIEDFDPDNIFGTDFSKRTNSLGFAYENLVTSTLSIDGSSAIYDVYFNTSAGNIDNITQSLCYYLIAHDCNRVTSGAVGLTVSHIQVEAWLDREAEIYEEILDQIAANQEVIIDRQGTIINYGSENELPSGGSQLSQVESQLSSAEEAVLNKSSVLKDSVAQDWNNQKSDARDFVNTISPSTQVFLTVYNDFVSVLPDNVKILFVVLPLLIFIGWLVGRIN